MQQLIDTHTFQLGENLRVETQFFDNGDDENFVWTRQRLVVEGKGGVDSAQLDLIASAFGPAKLRELANKLDSAFLRAKSSKQPVLTPSD